MRKWVLLWLMAIPAFGHPLPEGHCDTTTIVAYCTDTCKQGEKGEVFAECMNECLYNTTCPITAFSIKSASDTPPIEGVWVGNIQFSSSRGTATEPAELTIETNDNGSMGASLLVRPDDPSWEPVGPEFFDDIFGVLTQTGQQTWSVSLGYDAGLVLGTYTTVSEDTFTLEVSCVLGVPFPPQFTFDCPFSATMTLHRQE